MKKLLENNLDKIFGYSLFITGDREKALDLMQETIVTALTKQHLYHQLLQDDHQSLLTIRLHIHKLSHTNHNFGLR